MTHMTAIVQHTMSIRRMPAQPAAASTRPVACAANRKTPTPTAHARTASRPRKRRSARSGPSTASPRSMLYSIQSSTTRSHEPRLLRIEWRPIVAAGEQQTAGAQAGRRPQEGDTHTHTRRTQTPDLHCGWGAQSQPHTAQPREAIARHAAYKIFRQAQ